MIARHRHVRSRRLDVPERRIDGVVLGHLIDAVGEVVWQQPPAHPRGKGAQHRGTNLWSTGFQRQSAQGDRGVAPPVVEPGVAGDHRPADRRGWIRWPRRGGNAPANQEVVGGEHERLQLVARGDCSVGTIAHRLRPCE